MAATREARAPVCALAALVLLLAAVGAVGADQIIDAAVDPAGLTEQTQVGSVEVPGLGEVLVEGRAQGTALDLWAKDGDGRLVGETHTVVGPRESELFLRGPDGFTSIRVRWPAKSND